MALFKILKGNQSSLPAAKNDGYAYFCPDTGNFFIDALFNGSVQRIQLNANYAASAKDADRIEIETAALGDKLYLTGVTSLTPNTPQSLKMLSQIYTQSGYLNSLTPPTTDNSTKAATTAYVSNRIAQVPVRYNSTTDCIEFFFPV